MYVFVEYYIDIPYNKDSKKEREAKDESKSQEIEKSLRKKGNLKGEIGMNYIHEEDLNKLVFDTLAMGYTMKQIRELLDKMQLIVIVEGGEWKC